jgi:hypothetical protein
VDLVCGCGFGLNLGRASVMLEELQTHDVASHIS